MPGSVSLYHQDLFVPAPPHIPRRSVMARAQRIPRAWVTPHENIHGGIPVDVAYLTSSPRATAWTLRAEECQLSHTCSSKIGEDREGASMPSSGKGIAYPYRNLERSALEVIGGRHTDCAESDARSHASRKLLSAVISGNERDVTSARKIVRSFCVNTILETEREERAED